MLRHRLTLFWILLVTATVVSIEFVRGLFGALDEHAVGAAVLLIAFIKVRIVGTEFMELRRAPWGARVAFDAWVVVLAIALIVLYTRH